MIPMAHDEHMELHRIGRRSFEAKYQIDLEERALSYQKLYNRQAFDA